MRRAAQIHTAGHGLRQWISLSCFDLRPIPESKLGLAMFMAGRSALAAAGSFKTSK